MKLLVLLPLLLVTIAVHSQDTLKRATTSDSLHCFICNNASNTEPDSSFVLEFNASEWENFVFFHSASSISLIVDEPSNLHGVNMIYARFLVGADEISVTATHVSGNQYQIDPPEKKKGPPGTSVFKPTVQLHGSGPKLDKLQKECAQKRALVSNYYGCDVDSNGVKRALSATLVKHYETNYIKDCFSSIHWTSLHKNESEAQKTAQAELEFITTFLKYCQQKCH